MAADEVDRPGIRDPQAADWWTRLPAGSAIPADVRRSLLTGLGTGLEIEHAEFAWEADDSLTMTFRLAIADRVARRA